MPSLEDRNVCPVNTCSSCKHSIEIDLDYTEAPYEEYFCLLDLSDQDRAFIYKEVGELDMWFRPRGSDFSEKFLQIMKWKDKEELPPNCERCVFENDCCQYYERPSGEKK